MVIPSHEKLKEGVKIHLDNCYVKSFNRLIEVHTKFATKISGSDFKAEALKSNYQPQRDYRNDNKSGDREKGLVKIDEIDPESEGIKLVVKVKFDLFRFILYMIIYTKFMSQMNVFSK